MKDILIYLSIIRKRLWLILLMLISTVGTILAISFMNPPIYLAWVRFRVSAPPPTEVTLFRGFGNYDPNEEMLTTRAGFIDALTSSTVARRVIEKLQLSMGAEELEKRIVVEEVLQKELQSQTQSQLMKVAVRAEEPELAAALTNALMETTSQYYGEIRAKPMTMSREFIASQLQNTQQELHQARQDLIAFQIENKIGQLPAAVTLQQELIYQLRQDRDQAQARGDARQVANYDQLILQRQVELQSLVNLGLEYANLEAAVSQGESTYGFLLEKETEAKLKENETLTVSFLQVIGLALPPSSPQPQLQPSILALGAVISLVLGLVIAFIWHYIETGARSLLASVEDSPRRSTSSPGILESG